MPYEIKWSNAVRWREGFASRLSSSNYMLDLYWASGHWNLLF